MSKKIDYKKDFKHLYVPKNEPEIIDVPVMQFLMVSGSGDPNGDEFSKAVEALYSLSYAVRISYKSANVPSGYYQYTVFPLREYGTCLITRNQLPIKATLSIRS